MNTIITSRQDILKSSQKLAFDTGLQSINIRKVAELSGVSIGSVYNYFPSKADLVAATVETVWESVFHGEEGNSQPEGFVQCVVWLYNKILKGSEEYPSFFTLHSMSFAVEDKEKGRAVMTQYFAHMKKGLRYSLDEDKQACKDIFTDDFTKEDFINFVFSNIISLSIEKNKSCNTLIEVIKRLIGQ